MRSRLTAAILGVVLACVAGCTRARAVTGRRAPNEPGRVHPAGIQDPSSPDFHGQLVVDRGYDLGQCAHCHGEDFAGGRAAASCNGCHESTPTGCTTCHGAPPMTGAHLAHARGQRLGRVIDCAECHLKPATWDAPGHIRDEAGALITGRRAPRLEGRAATPTAERAGPPRYEDGTCRNVYCHGGAFADAAATDVEPVWSGGPSASECGACHGVPPAGHPGGRCDTCHGAVVDAEAKIKAPARHLDGVVTLGHDGSGSCGSCHPQPGGAHAAHVGATHGLAAPIACSECHVVPSAVDSPGHLSADGLADVFPSGGTGPRAAAYGAMPSFERASGTCADLHCHGGGGALGADQAVGLVRSPSWVGGPSAASCGACHGAPPIDGIHDVKWGLSTCATCHPQTMDASGQVLVSGGQSAHVNGIVDVR